MDQVREELQQMLRAKTAPRHDSSQYPALVEYIRVELLDRVPDGADISRFALALVFEAALRPGPVCKNDRGESAHPLRAAKHLLALGEYPEDVHAEVPDTAMSLYAIKNLDPKNPIKANDPRGPHTLGLRAQIAALASKYGESRGVLLKEGSKRLGEVVDALKNELQSLVADPSVVQMLGAKVTAEDANVPTVSSTGSVAATLRSALKQVDRAPSYYPSTMRPSLLAVSMSVSRVSRQSAPLALVEDVGCGHLYMHSHENSSSGGTSALPTLASMRRSVLLGDPGAGKSTILAARFVDHLQRDKRNIGLYARLSDVGEMAKARLPKSPSEAAAIVVEAFGLWSEARIGEADQRGLTASVLNDHRMLIVLDGLDEVLEPAAQRAVIEIIRNLHQIPGFVLCSSRFTGYSRPFESFEEVAVDQLTLSQVKSFVWSWYPEKSDPGRGRVRAAMRVSPILDLMRIPLMAGMVAFVAEHEAVPLRASALYERYIALFLEGRWKSPDRRRQDVVEIANLISLATDIAWEMGVGASIERAAQTRPTETQWTDTIVAHKLVEISGSRVSDLQQLTRVDGLLTLHGSSHPDEPLLHQQYRWLHRTVHEYLIGVHLAKQMRVEAEAVVEFIIAAMPDHRRWEVPIQYAIDQMRPFEQDLVLQTLRDKIAAGDPADLLAQLLPTLARMVDPASRERKRLIDEYIQTQKWQEAMYIDAKLTKSALLAELPNIHLADNADELAYGWFRKADAPLLEALIRVWSTRKSASREFAHALERMHELDPHKATRIALDNMQRIPTADVRAQTYWGFSGTAKIVAEIKREALTRSFPSNLQFVRLMAGLARGLEAPSEADFRDRPDFSAASLWAYRGLVPSGRVDAPRFFVEAVHSGRYGEWIAFRVPDRLTISVPADFACSPWGLAGRWFSDLGRGVSEKPDERDSAEAVARFNSFSNQALGDPVALVGVLRSIAACDDNCTNDQLAAALNLWVRAASFSGMNDHLDWPSSPIADIRTFRRLIGSGLIWRYRRRIWTLLKGGSIDLHGDSKEIASLILEAFAPEDYRERNAHDYETGEFRYPQFFEVCLWGAAARVPVLRALPRPSNRIAHIEQLFDNVPLEYLAMHENQEAIAEWLWEEGAYSAWRDKLLSLSKGSVQ